MAVSTTAAIITAAVLAAGSTVYSGEQQKKAQKKASEAQRNAEMDARRLAAEKKPMEESATLGFQTDTGAGDLTSLGLLVEADKTKKKPTGLGSATGGGTGLGFGG